MAEAGGGGFDTEFEWLSYLVYADRPEHVRAAGGPWAGVARVVEQASTVLEDGQVKLAEVWRSSAAQLYLTKMDEVSQAMREVSAVARHNGEVMNAAAQVLDAKQKDFAVLSTAPIPSEALEGYARAIVKSLDESYQQAVADFRPVPVPPESNIDSPEIVPAGRTGSRQDGVLGGGSVRPGSPVPSAGSVPSGGSGPSASQALPGGSVPSLSPAGTTPQGLPSWVPTQPSPASDPGDSSGPASAPGGGPQLQGIPGMSPGGGWSTPGPGNVPGTAPGSGQAMTPGGQMSPASAGPLPFGLGRVGARPVGSPPRSVDPGSPAGQPRSPSRPRTPGVPYASEATVQAEPASRTGPSARGGAGGPEAMLGGLPAGAPGGPGRGGWQGYRRPAELFPTTEQTAVTPVIGGALPGEQELISNEYADEQGNRITIRRSA